MRYLFQIDEDDEEKTRKALRVLESNLIKTLDACQFGILLFDTEGNCVGLNRRWQDIFQLDYTQVLGYNMLQDTNLQGKHIWEAIEKSFRGVPGAVDDNYFSPEEWNKPGRGRWTRGHAMPLFQNDNNMEIQVGQALILQDVTDEQVSRQELGRLSALLESVSAQQEALLESLAALERSRYSSNGVRPHTMPSIEKLRETACHIPRREKQIFEKLAAGLTVKETAHQLGLGAKSVYTYRRRLLQRLKLAGDVELAIAWREIHVIGEEPSDGK